MLALASSNAIVDTSALWKIIVASFAGGAGVVIAFGFLLLGVKRAGQAKDGLTRIGNYGISAFCAAFCLAAVALGIYAMAKKPASKKSSTAKPKTALVVRRSSPG
jgi:NADH:ubiquinone oxidoreductase subunit 6 (subunit J)